MAAQCAPLFGVINYPDRTRRYKPMARRLNAPIVVTASSSHTAGIVPVMNIVQ